MRLHSQRRGRSRLGRAIQNPAPPLRSPKPFSIATCLQPQWLSPRDLAETGQQKAQNSDYVISQGKSPNTRAKNKRLPAAICRFWFPLLEIRTVLLHGWPWWLLAA